MNYFKTQSEARALFKEIVNRCEDNNTKVVLLDTNSEEATMNLILDMQILLRGRRVMKGFHVLSVKDDKTNELIVKMIFTNPNTKMEKLKGYTDSQIITVYDIVNKA